MQRAPKLPRDPEGRALASMALHWHPAFRQKQFGGGEERRADNAQSVGAQQRGDDTATQPHQARQAYR